MDPIGDGNFSRFSLGERIKYVVVMLTNQARDVEKLPLPLSVVTRRALSLSLALCTKLVPCFNVVSEWLKFMTNIFRLHFGGIFASFLKIQTSTLHISSFLSFALPDAL